MGKFKDFLREETTSGDIATVDNKLNTYKHLQKGKKCKKHKKLNCIECQDKSKS